MSSRPVLILCSLLVCATTLQARLPPLRTDASIIDYTDRVVRLNKLSARISCLQYSADASEHGRIYVKAFELHDTKCGGDPQTQPLLFTIRYDLTRGAVATDKGAASGGYRSIRAPAG